MKKGLRAETGKLFFLTAKCGDRLSILMMTIDSTVIYDYLFPNQATVLKGGFGNLIALPLQHEPCKLERSVFVDENSQALADQGHS